MAASSYDEALRRLLQHEGGYSEHPADPGGPTKYGITLADVRRYVKADAAAQDVRALSLAQAKLIYRTRYWDALRCDALPAGVDYAVFDYGVNSGTARAARVLCALVGRPTAPQIDEAALRAAAGRAAADLVAALCDERLAFLKRLKTWPVFGSGWSRRVAEVRAAALAMAAGASAAAPSRAAAGKAQVPVNKAAQRAGAGGAAAGGALAAQQAHQAGMGAAAIAAIVVAAIAATIGLWLFWRWRQARQQAAPAVVASVETAVPRIGTTVRPT